MKKDSNKFKKILISHILVNNDYGFFAEYEEVYFYKKGVKILSTLENISNSLQEIDYYLLENQHIAKFIRYESLDNSKRELLAEYTIADKTKTVKDIVSLYSIKKEYLKTVI